MGRVSDTVPKCHERLRNNSQYHRKFIFSYRLALFLAKDDSGEYIHVP